MSAIIYSLDKQTLGVLERLLLDFGYGQILPARSLAHLRYYVEREKSRLQLVIACFDPTDPNRFQLFSIFRNRPDVDLVPFVFIADGAFGGEVAARAPSARFRRIDSVVSRPLGAKQLHQAIQKANEQRARFRDILVLVSTRGHADALEALFEAGPRSHWHAVEQVKNTIELKTLLEKHGARIGTILICEDCATDDMVNWAAKFKRSHHGSLTPIVFLSRDPGKTRALRQYSEIFFDLQGYSTNLVTCWTALLKLTSNRLISRWAAREKVRQFRDIIKHGNIKFAKSDLRRVKLMYPNFWEVSETVGHAYEKLGLEGEAFSAYESALRLNPCTPAAHLGRIRIKSSDEIFKDALNYCPMHPQIREISQLHIREPIA